ncbi:MAG: hypothetical protein OXI60_04915 [Acidiferrobacterales bacterium]|nr:hypothetical protein [Acidiferrobacterales bacterium]
MRVPVQIQILWHFGAVIGAGMGWTTDTIPQIAVYILIALWLITLGWTLCSYKSGIYSYWRRMRGKNEGELDLHNAHQVLQYWDEPESELEKIFSAKQYYGIGIKINPN